MKESGADGVKKKKRGLRDIARGAFAGAAMLGAVVASDVPTAHAQEARSQESQQSFDLQKEGAALIHKITQLKPEADNKVGWYALYIEQIRPLLNSFVQASGDAPRAAGILAAELRRIQDANPATSTNEGFMWLNKGLENIQQKPMSPDDKRKLDQLFGR